MSKEKVVITAKENRVYYGFYSDGIPLELYCDKRDRSFQIGDIHVARVDRLADGIQGAFVSIGNGEKAFYRLSKNYARDLIKLTPGHEDKLYGGDLILVQLSKESSGDKLPVVSEKITIQSAYFLLSFADQRISVSKKITDSDKKDFLIRLMQEAVSQDQNSCGLLARTMAQDVDEDILLQDLQSLLNEYHEIVRKSKIAPGGSLIYRSPAEYITLAKELRGETVEEIITDNLSIYEELKDYYQKQSYTGMTDKIRLYQDEYSLWLLYRMEHFYDMALSRKVYLKSGGTIVIDPTEAMTVIDVNSGSVIKKKKADALYYSMNLEAADEIFKQIRLRNLSGIILVDFINMRKKEDQYALMEYMKERALTDRIPVQVVDLTKLGLVEMMRERRKLSLREQWKL